MTHALKKSFYFPLSYYFRFFAKIRLKNWNPYIIVVTGSSGKTTLLHLIESQIGDKAKYSHHANSTYGIPFNILRLKRESLEILEWIGLIIKTPLAIFKKLPEEKFYIVEADCDRPEEGKFLATLLKPDITLWTNSTKTHSMNFDELVSEGKFATVEEAIAFEFGYFIEHTKDLVIANGDSKLIDMQFGRTKAEIKKVEIKDLKSYEISDGKTTFASKETYKFDHLLPKEFFYSLEMTIHLLKKLSSRGESAFGGDIKPDPSFSDFRIPPGRNSIFKGVKNTTIIDSSYNANLDSMTAVLNMFENINAPMKWIVAGDMLEQGRSERQEHEKLADLLSEIEAVKIILMGPRVLKYTLPKLKTKKNNVIGFENPDEVLEYLKENLKGGETILFKGARFLEGVIENLLADKNDAASLARREKIWQERRRKFGL